MIKIFDGILTGIGQALRWFESWTGSYMVALLIFAVIVEIVFLPFGIKQQKNQIRQAKLRPKEMAIRNKYKGRDDQVTRQKMQQEIADFYQKENFNPASGCLPLLIQLPIIMALYSIVINPLKYVIGFSGDQISKIIEVIKEAGQTGADKLNASQTIPIINHIKNMGVEAFSSVDGFADKVSSVEELPNFNVFGNFNLGLTPSSEGFSWLLIIPVLVFVVQFVTTKLMRKLSYQAPSVQDANMGCSNTVMDITMPLMTTYFAYTLPGAIGVYWTAKNVISFVKQFILSKAMPMPVFTEEDYKAAEREINSKNTKKLQKNSDGSNKSGKYVRSLHHIDDEDFEDTRERALRAKELAEKAAKEAEEKEAAERGKKNGGKISAAPIKSENNKADEKSDTASEEKAEENK
ncbi:MAG: YidC/Oxa1 family membrane protein insertase [Clostridia bacterium]|nr:YidC/Oxa1 family membrane protein insertase [Clostridia bacterium]